MDAPVHKSAAIWWIDRRLTLLGWVFVVRHLSKATQSEEVFGSDGGWVPYYGVSGHDPPKTASYPSLSEAPGSLDEATPIVDDPDTSVVARRRRDVREGSVSI